MNVLDVNVLLALYRPEHTHHEPARHWWDRAQAAGEQFTVPDVVWIGFCRLVTSSRVVDTPATFEQAWQFVGAVTANDTYLTYAADPRVLGEFRRIGVESRIGSALVTDTYIAAVASSLGATVVTFDRDFRRFDGVRVHEPA